MTSSLNKAVCANPCHNGDFSKVVQGNTEEFAETVPWNKCPDCHEVVSTTTGQHRGDN